MIIEKAPPSMGTVGCDGEPYTWRRQPEKWRPIDRRTVLYSRDRRRPFSFERCLRCLLLVMCTHPFAKEALTLHLARSESQELESPGNPGRFNHETDDTHS